MGGRIRGRVLYEEGGSFWRCPYGCLSGRLVCHTVAPGFSTVSLLMPGAVKPGWSGDEGQDDGGPQASHRGALAPSPPGPPSAPYWLHHDSRWCWAGRARCLQTHRNRRIDKTMDGASTYTQPAPTCPAPSHTPGPGPGGLLPPRPDLSRKRATERVREGPGRWWWSVTRSR